MIQKNIISIIKKNLDFSYAKISYIKHESTKQEYSNQEFSLSWFRKKKLIFIKGLFMTSYHIFS